MNKIQKYILYIRRQRNKRLKLKEKNLYLSFGENCLTDSILERNNLKSFSTPYSSARTNVENILAIEKDEFKDFLNKDYLKYEYDGDSRLLRLKKYNEIKNKYEKTCCNGFEFTHHDVLNDHTNYCKMERRYKRLLNLNNHDIFIFYYHRYCPDTDMELLVKHLSELKDIYLGRCKRVEVIMFTQDIVSDNSERDVVKTVAEGIYMYTFKTLNIWEGLDENIFWARCDDDLIQVMIDDIKKM